MRICYNFGQTAGHAVDVVTGALKPAKQSDWNTIQTPLTVAFERASQVLTYQVSTSAVTYAGGCHADALQRTKASMAAQYRQLAVWHDKKRTALVVAHSILVMAYYMLIRREPYPETGPEHMDRHRSAEVTSRFVKPLESLSYQVIPSQPNRLAAA